MARQEQQEQPDPAQPVVPDAVWQRVPSQMTDDELGSLSTATERANDATPGLQRLLTALPIVAILLTLAAAIVFNTSHYRAMDIAYGANSSGQHTGVNADYKVYGLAFIAVSGRTAGRGAPSSPRCLFRSTPTGPCV